MCSWVLRTHIKHHLGIKRIFLIHHLDGGMLILQSLIKLFLVLFEKFRIYLFCKMFLFHSVNYSVSGVELGSSIEPGMPNSGNSLRIGKYS